MLLKTILYPKQNRKKPNANFPMGRECVTKRRGFCDRAESSNQLFFFLSLLNSSLSISLSLSLVVFFGGNSPFLSVLACYNLSWCHCDDAFSCFWSFRDALLFSQTKNESSICSLGIATKKYTGALLMHTEIHWDTKINI